MHISAFLFVALWIIAAEPVWLGAAFQEKRAHMEILACSKLGTSILIMAELFRRNLVGLPCNSFLLGSLTMLFQPGTLSTLSVVLLVVFGFGSCSVDNQFELPLKLKVLEFADMNGCEEFSVCSSQRFSTDQGSQ